jgi:hypothetical protein
MKSVIIKRKKGIAMLNIGMVFVTCLKWQKAADFEVGCRNIKFTSVVIIMNKEMILYSYLYSYCVGPAACRRTHTHTYIHTHFHLYIGDLILL